MHGLMRLQKNTEVRMIIDANVILRCILNDNQQLAMQAKSLIENNDCFVPNEVVVEVVFVLQKVYNVPREEIKNLIIVSFNYFEVSNEMLLRDALLFYAQTKLDFVDCLLAAYYSVENHQIGTLDKKLNNFISQIK